MSDAVILHHFDASPFSEKIRVIFGFKRIAWQSVLISRIMPRPDLIPLSGGYRRTPIMQIGADIYCDTQIIIREIERRFPQPTLFPDGNAGLPYALGLWTDRTFFQNSVNLVFGSLGDKVPVDFIADRTKLRGAPFDIAAMKAGLPHMQDQFRAHVDMIAAQLADGREWLLRDFSLADVNAYMNVWYARGNMPEIDSALAEFPAVQKWIARIREIGHGTRTEMTSQEALAITAKAEPQTIAQADPHDPNGRKPGDKVTVMPDDYGKVGVTGEIVSLSAQHIAIRRTDPQAGELVVHFPRIGFSVSPL